MERKHRIAYVCLNCEREFRILISREEYKETQICKECEGLLVDKWMVHKYQHLKATTKKPLIRIELDTYGSVPRVFHKGEEIDHKTSIQFEWNTDTDIPTVGPYIKIEHLHKDDNDCRCTLRTIEYRDPLED